MSGDLVIRRASALIGTPYRHMGRSRHGIDCLGLVLAALGIDEASIPEIGEGRALAGYYTDRRWFARKGEAMRRSSDLLAACLTKHLLMVSWADLSRGDVLAMNFKMDDRRPDHVGLYDGRGRVIHADIRRGVVSDPLAELQHRVVAQFRSPT